MIDYSYRLWSKGNTKTSLLLISLVVVEPSRRDVSAAAINSAAVSDSMAEHGRVGKHEVAGILALGNDVYINNVPYLLEKSHQMSHD